MKKLQKELDEKKDLDADNTALKQRNEDLAKENRRMQIDIDRMKTLLLHAESRADEKEHELKKSLKRAPDVVSPLDAPPLSQSVFNRDARSVSTPIPQERLPSAFRTPARSKHIEPDASPYVSAIQSPNPTPLLQKRRGVMLDFTVKRERLDFKFFFFNLK